MTADDFRAIHCGSKSRSGRMCCLVILHFDFFLDSCQRM
jgi:hypothetical protein